MQKLRYDVTYSLRQVQMAIHHTSGMFSDTLIHEYSELAEYEKMLTNLQMMLSTIKKCTLLEILFIYNVLSTVYEYLCIFNEQATQVHKDVQLCISHAAGALQKWVLEDTCTSVC